jgi:hypothetical protein
MRFSRCSSREKRPARVSLPWSLSGLLHAARTRADEAIDLRDKDRREKEIKIK